MNCLFIDGKSGLLQKKKKRKNFVQKTKREIRLQKKAKGKPKFYRKEQSRMGWVTHYARSVYSSPIEQKRENQRNQMHH